MSGFTATSLFCALATIALLIFGPRKLGELGKSLGEGIRGFKSAMKDADSDPTKP